MIYITQANSQQSLKDFLQEYVASTSGEWRGIGIFRQIEIDADRYDWISKNAPFVMGVKEFERSWSNRTFKIRHTSIQSKLEWERVLKDYKKTGIEFKNSKK